MLVHRVRPLAWALLMLAAGGARATAAPPAEGHANSVGIRLVPVAPGTFLMGQDGPQADYRMAAHPSKFDDADYDERQAHKVTLTAPFRIAATEVTNAQYEQFDPARKAKRLKAKAPAGDDEAVVDVSWDDAVAFCKWLSEREGKPYRLPTEAEWEYACRAGTTTLFHTGDALPAGFHKWIDNGRRPLYFPDGKLPPEVRDPPAAAPLTVGRTPANAWGLYDMHGNVAEWCLDWYGPYEAADQTDPLGRADGVFRCVRGGSHSVFTRLLRSANRGGRRPDERSSRVGFRVVQAGPPVGKVLPAAPPPLALRDVNQAPVAGDPGAQPPAWGATERVPLDRPYFAGPRQFVKVPGDLLGPLYSRHNHSPSIAACPNGDLLAIWFTCVEEPGTEVAVAASRLRRGSAEWEAASPFFDTPDVNDHYPKLWNDGNGTLYFMVGQETHSVLRTSADSGATWSPPRAFAPMGEVGNTPVRLRDGTIVAPIDNEVSLVRSGDDGRTWDFLPGRGVGDLRPGGTGLRAAGI
ncbi:MAG TPA: SUMF1/EgtB/PvdO family nonheme iron enzyme, partial [Humisphaera sp.]